ITCTASGAPPARVPAASASRSSPASRRASWRAWSAAWGCTASYSWAACRATPPGGVAAAGTAHRNARSAAAVAAAGLLRAQAGVAAAGLHLALAAMAARRVPGARGARLGTVAEHLIDRGEAGLKAVAGRAQVQPPDAQALVPGEALGLLAICVQA